MFVSTLKYQETNLFSKLINDYLDGNLDKSFYLFDSNLDGFKNKIVDREKYPIDRTLLVDVLKKQNAQIALSEKSLSNIESLNSTNTFTVTTGHQLNLMGGPLYFVYKIASTIKLSIQLKEVFPEKNFVPIYWMATEDHDFQEINHFYFGNDKFQWNTDQGGAVGRFKTEGLDVVFEEFAKVLPKSMDGEYLQDLFKKAYLNNTNLAQASRCLVNELFSEFGIVILDGDDKELKESFSKVIKSELKDNLSYKSISDTIEKLSDESYKIQVNPREINLFYLGENSRERIVFDPKSNNYYLNESKIQFTYDEIIAQVNEFPDKFSPNAVMRPVYQEFVLPNLAYIGGAGELTYWFELKSTFESYSVSFPVLTLRDAGLIIDQSQWRKIEKLDISIKELFFSAEQIIKRLARENSQLDLSDDFSKAEGIFDSIIEKLGDNHPMRESFSALKAKQLKLLDQSKKKLDRYNKKQIEDLSNSVYEIYDFTMPKGKIQERRMNFSMAYLIFSKEFIQGLIDVFEPLEDEFTILINK